MPDNDLANYLDPVSPRGGWSDRVRSAATRANISSDVADDFLKVTGGIESGNSHYDANGHVRLSVPNSNVGGERAIGGSQILPSTARRVDPRLDPMNEDDNAELGLRYFAQGGSDPIARRIHYFGGEGAARRYQRTGRIPQGRDANGTTFQQYVTQTSGHQDDLNNYLDPATPSNWGGNLSRSTSTQPARPAPTRRERRQAQATVNTALSNIQNVVDQSTQTIAAPSTPQVAGFFNRQTTNAPRSPLVKPSQPSIQIGRSGRGFTFSQGQRQQQQERLAQPPPAEADDDLRASIRRQVASEGETAYDRSRNEMGSEALTLLETTTYRQSNAKPNLMQK